MPGICNGNPETVVLCHLNGAGMGMKSSDIHASYGCSECHDEADRRTRRIGSATAELYHLHGMVRTQIMMMGEGLITHAGKR